MKLRKPKRAIGLMSGTSLDGIDAAVVETDGDTVFAFGEAVTVPYPLDFQNRLRALLGRDPMRLPEAGPVIEELTLRHATAVERVMEAGGIRREDICVIGFHGHTVLHEPDRGITRQIGDGALLARETGILVVDDFRSSDIAAGGEGADCFCQRLGVDVVEDDPGSAPHHLFGDSSANAARRSGDHGNLATQRLHRDARALREVSSTRLLQLRWRKYILQT